MNDSGIMSLIAMIIAVALAVALIILYKKRVVGADLISGATEVFQSLPVTEGSGVFGKILEYSKTAVLTVEQLVKTGKISRDDEARKDKAMEIVTQAAAVDDVPFGATEQEVASACIEAEVQKLPRNQPPDGE